MKTDKIQCAIIQYSKKNSLHPRAILEDMVKTYGEDTPSYTMIKEWSAEFRKGRDGIKDDLQDLQLQPNKQSLPESKT